MKSHTAPMRALYVTLAEYNSNDTNFISLALLCLSHHACHIMVVIFYGFINSTT